MNGGARVLRSLTYKLGAFLSVTFLRLHVFKRVLQLRAVLLILWLLPEYNLQKVSRANIK